VHRWHLTRSYAITVDDARAILTGPPVGKLDETTLLGMGAFCWDCSARLTRKVPELLDEPCPGAPA
jgi:hypothetical protein